MGRINRMPCPVLKLRAMSWLDIVLIGLIAFGALRGLRVGLLGAAVNVVALVIGWLAAAQVANVVSGLAGGFGSTGTTLTVAAYIVVMSLALVGMSYLWKILRPALGIATMGASSMVDKVGGLLLGLVVGLVLSGALILALARFTYELPTSGGLAAAPLAVADTRVELERGLAESVGVGLFVNAVDALPAGALGFVPSDFRTSLELVESGN